MKEATDIAITAIGVLAVAGAVIGFCLWSSDKIINAIDLMAGNG